ncbi:MAG TPA: glycosyltransferase family 87 protein [Pirellulales bacterium]|nr:glycosyltransferase family 87 protein [Pirellulales bacterium]
MDNQPADAESAAIAPCPAPAAEAPESGQPGPWPWWLGRHPLLALTAALVIWGLIDVRSRGRIEPGNLVEHRTDFTVYTAAGAACFDGRDPYAVTNARGWGYLYPPLPAIVVAPLATLDPEWQVTIWFFVSLLLLWGCYRETTLLVDWLAAGKGTVPFCCADSAKLGPSPAWESKPSHFAARTSQNWNSPHDRPPNWLPWAAAIAAALPTLNCLQRGQVGLVQLYLLLAGFRLLMVGTPRGRFAAAWRALPAGVILALAVVIKVTAALPVGLLLVERLAAARRQPRPGEPARRKNRSGDVAPGLAKGLAAGLALGLALWLLLVPGWAIGWQRNLDCLARWCSLVPTKAIDTGPSLFAGDSYSVRNQSLVNAIRHLGNWIAEDVARGGDSLPAAGPHDAPRAMDSPVANGLLLAARLAVLGLAVLAAVWAGRRRDPLATASLFALGLVASLVVSPVARTHYFLLVAPAVLFVPWQLERAGRRRLAWWMAWTPTVLVVPHYFWPLAAGRVGWLGIGITVWLVAAGIWLWSTGRTRRGGPMVLAWREMAPRQAAEEEIAPTASATDRSAHCRAAAASCAAGGFDPSES